MGRPGKFEGCADQDLGEALHAITLDDACDDELGDVQDFGWYGLISVLSTDSVVGVEAPKDRWFIVNEDSNGFFDYEEFDDEASARKAWKKLESAFYVESVDEAPPDHLVTWSWIEGATTHHESERVYAGTREEAREIIADRLRKNQKIDEFTVEP